MTMKLAEALVRRADIQKRMAQVHQRAMANARYQDGDEPAEDPATLIAEYDRMAGELADLVRRINETNIATRFDDQGTLTAALARRDALALRRNMLSTVAQAATVRVDRYSRSEVRSVAAIDVRAAQRTADELARAYRELDTAIQEKNWTTELLD
jgi:hypothetical protein